MNRLFQAVKSPSDNKILCEKNLSINHTCHENQNRIALTTEKSKKNSLSILDETKTKLL